MKDLYSKKLTLLNSFFVLIYLAIFSIPYALQNTAYKRSNISYRINLNSVSVSILIPIYNKHKYLNRSLHSAQFQTQKDIEIIVIDDFSTDNSTNFIKKKMEEDKRIKLIQHNYNQGTCLTRIHGVFLARGEFIISLDADDLLYANTTAIAYQLAHNLSSDIIDMRYELRHKNNIISNWQPCSSSFTNMNILHKLFLNFVFRNVNWNLARKFIRTNIYQKSMNFLLPFVENKRICQAEDLLHCGVVFLLSKNFYCSHLPIYVYFFALSDASGTYQSQMQHQAQLFYVKSLIIYFYKNKENLSNASLQNYLNDNITNLELYRNVSNVKKTDNVCNISQPGFNVFPKSSYCIITKYL